MQAKFSTGFYPEGRADETEPTLNSIRFYKSDLERRECGRVFT